MVYAVLVLLFKDFLQPITIPGRASSVHRWRHSRPAALWRSTRPSRDHRHLDVNGHRHEKLYSSGRVRQ